MKLDIIIPHYKEPWDVCKYLFDTIATQRGVFMGNIRVIMVNDGEDNCFVSDVFLGYPFEIIQLGMPHGGVSAARNHGLDNSDADYVMFCDCDDGFLSNYGLHLVFSAMQEGADYIVSNFVEETYTDNNAPTIIRHDNDYTFMHGKVYKRQFLVDHNLRFDESMTIHEDGYFNALVLATAQHEGKIKTIDTPFYLWMWHDNSTVRKDRQDFVLKTYESLMQTRIGVCKELKRRGYKEDYETAVCMTVLNSYYDFQKASYWIQKNDAYRRKAERAFASFYSLFGMTFRNCTNIKIAEVAVVARENACKNGMMIEREDLRTFLKRMKK